MKNFYTEEQWNEILKQQESVLCYDTFTRKQALELGLLIAEVTEKKYHGSVAVRIETECFQTQIICGGRDDRLCLQDGGRDAGSRLVDDQ